MKCPEHNRTLVRRRSPVAGGGDLLVCPEGGCPRAQLAPPPAPSQRKLAIEPGRQQNAVRGLSEEAHQTRLFEEIARHKAAYPLLDLVFHVPNGGIVAYKTYVARDGKTHRYSPQGLKLQRMGLKPGVSDIFCPVARDGFHGLWIEMKAGDNTLSEAQVEWQERMRAQGFRAESCWDWERAWRLLVAYLGLPL